MDDVLDDVEEIFTIGIGEVHEYVVVLMKLDVEDDDGEYLQQNKKLDVEDDDDEYLQKKKKISSQS